MITFIKDNSEIIGLAVAIVGLFSFKKISKKKNVQIQKAKSGKNSIINQIINNKESK